MRIKASLLCGTAAAVLSGSPALAQQDTGQIPSVDDTIIVTAQRRAEATQDVPISITSISSETLEQANIEQLGDIAKLSPATRFDYNSNFVQPTIRGVGTAVVTSGGGANVGIYTDGFYSPNPLAADFQLLSVESIQVLKGPQGTLFGRNTTGGAILVTTSKPSYEPRAIVELSYGRFDTIRAQSYVSGGITDNIAVDLEGSYALSNGYVRNLAPDGDPDIGGYRNWSVRAGLRFDVSDSVSFLLRYTHRSNDDATNLATGFLQQDGVIYSRTIDPALLPPSLLPIDYREVSLVEPVGFRFNGDVVQLTGEFDLGFADLTSYTQYRDERATTYLDPDQTPIRAVSTLIPIVDETFTQELLLTSKGGGRLSWTAGAFYFHYKDTYDGVQLSIGGSPFFVYAGSSSTTESIAGYLDVTYEIVDRLFLTGGLRYSHDEFGDPYQFALGLGEFFPDPVKDDRLTPRAVVRYELSNDASVYASFSKGYKAPLIDLARATGPAPVEAETITAYEAGFKYASRALSFNLATWYYDYKNLQVSTYTEDNLARIDNAANARIYGVEGDIRYQVTPDFQISAAAAYTNAKYEDFPASNRVVRCPDPTAVACGDSRFITVPFDSSGLQMQRAPEFTGNLAASYGFDLGGGRLNLFGNLYYTSAIYFDAAEQFRQDGYELLGLRAAWTDPSERMTVAVFGENLTGSEYLRQFNTGGLGAGWGAPETWGVSLRYEM